MSVRISSYKQVRNDHPPLTYIEEQDLAVQAKSDGRAKERLILSKLGLVYHIASGYYGVPLDDLVQEGILGLIRAIDKFDLSRGIDFSGYAGFWIRRQIARYVNDNGNGVIRIPGNAQELVKAASKIVAISLRETGKRPTYAEITKKLNLNTPKNKGQYTVEGVQGIVESAKMAAQSTSLDAQLDNNHGLLEILANGSGDLEAVDSRIYLFQLAEAISRIENACKKEGVQLSAAEIAKRLNPIWDTEVSPEQVGRFMRLRREGALELILAA